MVLRTMIAVAAFIFLSSTTAHASMAVQRSQPISKEEYLKSKKARAGDRINVREQVTQEFESGKSRRKQLCGVAGNPNDLNCKFKKIEKKVHARTATYWAQLRQWWARWTLKIQMQAKKLYPTRLANFLQIKTKLTNIPPTAGGGLDVFYTGNTERPEVILRTLDVLNDPDGIVTKVVWNFGDGSEVEIPRAEVNDYAEVSHYYKDSDHYVATLKIYDDSDEYTEYSRYTETDYNDIPLPTFTVSQTQGSSPMNVSFSATGVDPENENVDYSWDIDGTPVYGKNITHLFSAAGVYPVTLTVKDITGGVASATVDIYVDEVPPEGSTAPTGIILASETFGDGPLTVTFDATKSFDADSSIVSYMWDFDDYDSSSNFANTSVANHTFNRPGTYNVTLILTDEGGAESYTQIFIHVIGEEPLAPQITARQRDDDPLVISFDGEPQSLRTSAPRSQYWWDFGDGNTSSNKRGVTHTYASAGTYEVVLNVVDLQGIRHSVSKEITIGSSIDTPVAIFSMDVKSASINQVVSFDGSESLDEELNEPLTYRWDFGDGKQVISTSPYVEYAFENIGLYRVQLAVTNSRGISHRRGKFISIRDGQGVAMDVRYSPKAGAPPLLATFDGSRTSSVNSPIEQYTWMLDAEYFMSDKVSHQYSFEDEGEFFVEAFAKDAVGNEGYAEKIVSVVDPSNVPIDNHPPIAEMLFFDTAPMTYSFDCYDSEDPDEFDYLLTCDWKINGVELQDAFEFTHVFDKKQKYTIELTVTDVWGAQGKTAAQLDLTEQALPSLAFSNSPIKPTPGSLVRFSAEESSLPGAQITNYSWDFGDSSTADGLNVEHTFASAGTYTVELTLTDSESNEHVVSKVITVATAANPNLQLSIRDAELVSPTGLNTYTSDKVPSIVTFSVLATSDSVTAIKNAVWDFGDGQFGYGPEVEYTYTKPGIYNIEVTGYDADGRYNQASGTVTIEAGNCINEDNQATCLTGSGLTDYVVPVSGSIFEVTQLSNDLSLSGSTLRSLNLKSLNGNDSFTDLHGTFSGYDINIPFAQIVNSRALNFDSSYRLSLLANVPAISGNSASAQWPEFYFGGSELAITVSDLDTKLLVVHTGASLRRYFNLTSTTTATISNWPSGNVSIIAERNGKSMIKTVRLTPMQTTSVSLDVDDLALRKFEKSLAKKASAKSSKRLKFADWKQRENSFVKSIAGRNDKSGGGLCGEEPPFAAALPRSRVDGNEFTWNFSSYEPQAQVQFKQLPPSMSRQVRLSCGISSDSLMYGYAKWKYKDGPGRCWGEDIAQQYWKWFLSRMKRETEGTVIKYEVKDAWTGEKYLGHMVTSPRDIMRKQGLSLNDLTWQTGVPQTPDQDWSLRANYDLTIPPQYQRPEIRFELYAPDVSDEHGTYVVDCDVEWDDATPKVIAVSEPSTLTDRADWNARHSLQNRYGMFPVHYDDAVDSPVSAQADLGKVRYQLKISENQVPEFALTGIDVEWRYADSVFTKTYSLPVVKDISQAITLDTEEIANNLSAPIGWNQNQDVVELKIRPTWTSGSGPEQTGPWRHVYFRSLFDLKTLKNQLELPVCDAGFYESTPSAFVRGSMMNALVEAGKTTSGMLCGAFSLPFGGDYVTTAKSLKGLKNGRSGFIKTFNADSGLQDAYDDVTGISTQKKSDLEAYLEFSNAAEVISTQADERPSNMTDKNYVYEFCHPDVGEPKAPCTANTQFEDLDHKMILEICSRYGSDLVPAPGCPTEPLLPAIRLSKWVEKNMSPLSALRTHSVTSTFATGVSYQLAGASPLEWQKNLFMSGIWPDGMPIFKAAETGDRFVDERIDSCHERKNGCVLMNEMFAQDGNSMTSMPIRQDWR